MKKLPVAPLENIVVQNLSNEILIYNMLNNEAYCLNETASIVYNACDGTTSFEELKKKHKFSDDLIYMALEDLRKKGLVEDFDSPLAGLSRREVVRRVGFASLIALPVAASLIAPTSAMARSVCTPPGSACSPGNFTQGDCCDGYRCYDLGNCYACYDNGTRAIVSAPGFYTDASCGALPNKNACCGTSFKASADGSACVCGA